MRPVQFLVVLLAAAARAPAVEPPIDREAVVARHRVVLTELAPDSPLQVGNGEFAFGTDLTGLQTFHGNTMAQWGWHTRPLPSGLNPADFRLETYDVHGRSVGYATSAKGQEELYRWLRENPHRINLGRIGLRGPGGRRLAPGDLQDARQELDLWRGLLVSRFRLGGVPVEVETAAHPTLDAVSARIVSPRCASGGLAVSLAFPGADPASVDGADWSNPDRHETDLTPQGERGAVFRRTLDGQRYAARLAWEGPAALVAAGPHEFMLTPGSGATALAFTCRFALKTPTSAPPPFAEAKAAAAEHWRLFWSTGGAVDFSGSRDPRWRELERRVVLSQYLLAVNEAGSLPPQESGLINNSGWYGKFHLEMHWWHGAHYALWDRWPLFARSLGWYRDRLPEALELARLQGYRGARWPKMVGPEGRDSPSGVGPLLIWQQPHPIFYAELDYRREPSPETLARWRHIVFESAEFMASYAAPDTNHGRFVLGPPLKDVAEKSDPRTTSNPTFELSYWRWGLRAAQQWRERLGLPREPAWDRVFQGLAPLPVQDGVYLQQEGMTDTYTKWNWEHPSLIGAFGLQPGDGVDAAVMRATVPKVFETWQWDRCWGWDFPMMAMAAARNGQPRIAVDALLHPSRKNACGPSGVCRGGPAGTYLPGNGGLLYAVALMAAGWDASPAGPAPARRAPGFPDDGSWSVRFENLRPAP